MGISGHMLGPKKLRKLSKLTGLPLSRAYIRNKAAEGVVWTSNGCEHYWIDPKTGEWEFNDLPSHWYTCSPEQRP